MKNLLFLLVCLVGFSYSFANSDLSKSLEPTETIVMIDNNAATSMDCQLLADTTVQILNNMGFPESGTAVIGNIILGICETIFN